MEKSKSVQDKKSWDKRELSAKFGKLRKREVSKARRVESKKKAKADEHIR